MSGEKKRIEMVTVESTDNGAITDTIVVKAKPGKLEKFIWSAEDQGLKQEESEEGESDGSGDES